MQWNVFYFYICSWESFEQLMFIELKGYCFKVLKAIDSNNEYKRKHSIKLLPGFQIFKNDNWLSTARA